MSDMQDSPHPVETGHPPALCRRAVTLALLLGAAGAWGAPPEGKGGPPKEHGGKVGGRPEKAERRGEVGERGNKGTKAVDSRHDRPHEARAPSGGSRGAETLVTAGISVGDARRIAIDVGIRPGTYDPLPPGIRKNLARGKPLPPGIAKKVAPPAMVAHLPVHPGYEWRIVGSDLVLVAVATLIIADVLFDVF